MRRYASGELRLLNRMAISPHLRQVDLANDLGVTRSAVNQIWTKLERECELRVRSKIDYAALDLRHIAGWVSDNELSHALEKFNNWLESNPFIISSQESVMTSGMDHRVLFEILAPEGRHLSHITRQLERFTKRPYSLTVNYDLVHHESVHFNLGLFDGNNWDFEGGFRLGATISAAKSYADVLPSYTSDSTDESQDFDFTDIMIALALGNDYHLASSDIRKLASNLGYSVPSGRTLRRKINRIKESIAKPYLSIQNIGLSTPFTLCLERRENDNLPRLMHAQAESLPKSRVLSGSKFVLMLLEIPESIEWVALSQIFSEMVGLSTNMCTFIAQNYPRTLEIEELLIRLM
ncbi:hypothetical protein EU537_12230 [Candidatus Thorarchaeota archaeon]|nr:MAG: hypothetical protein EU537_12230 [Candidatus Thorarchaeota archaeon]